MTKHANCVVSIMFAKIVRVAAVAPVPALADPRPAAVSSQKVNPLVARWEPMQRIQELAHHVAMHARPSVKNVPTTQAHATTISATAPKLLVRRVLQAIAHKVIVHHFKIVARVHKVIARRVTVLRIKIVVRARREIVHKVIVQHSKIAAPARRAARIAIRPNSAAGMCPMVSTLAHV
jgi:hypothetical protein